MKKLPMLLLLTAPYLLLGSLFWRDPVAFVPVGIVYFAVSLLISMVYPFSMPRLGFSVRQMLLWSMVLKLSAIPFYVLVFLTALLLNVMIIPALPLVIFSEYLLVLASGMYGIRGLLRAYRRGSISKRFLAVHMAAHLIFCTDVVSAVYCYLKLRKVGDPDGQGQTNPV